MLATLATGWLIFSGCSKLEEALSSGARSRDVEADGDPTPGWEKPGAEVESPLLDTSGWSKEKVFAYFNVLRGDAYPLDEVPRRLESDAKLPCDPKALEVYRGTHLKFAPLTVHPALVERIARFEQVVRQVGEEVYGRAPTRVRHLGGYACRTSRFRSARISEHALGNAIDIAAFDFPPLPKTKETGLSPAAQKTTGTPDAALPSNTRAILEPAPVGLPVALRGPFQVTVKRHWVSRGGSTLDLHAAFLQRVTERVKEENIFRVMLGPSHRGHEDHLHFDMSPWTYTHL